LKSRFDALPSVNTQVRKGKFKWGSGLPRSWSSFKKNIIWFKNTL
jgi:hypothetical protein